MSDDGQQKQNAEATAEYRQRAERKTFHNAALYLVASNLKAEIREMLLSFFRGDVESGPHFSRNGFGISCKSDEIHNR